MVSISSSIFRLSSLLRVQSGPQPEPALITLATGREGQAEGGGSGEEWVDSEGQDQPVTRRVNSFPQLGLSFLICKGEAVRLGLFNRSQQLLLAPAQFQTITILPLGGGALWSSGGLSFGESLTFLSWDLEKLVRGWGWEKLRSRNLFSLLVPGLCLAR